MAEKKTTTMSFSMDSNLLHRIDDEVAVLQGQYPGLRVSRSSVIRSIVLRWLDQDQPAPRKRTRKMKEQ